MSQHNEITPGAAQPAPLAVEVHGTGLSSRPPASSSPDAGAILTALLRRWKLATFAGLIGGAAAAVFVYFCAPQAKYKSQAMLHVSTNQPRVIIDTNEIRPDFRTYQKTQETLLKSRLVLGAALNRPEVRELPVVTKQVDPIEWLDKELKVEFTGGSEILRVSMSGEDARSPTLLVNAVTQSYLDEVVSTEEKLRRDRQKMLKENWSRYQESLKQKRQDLKQLAELAGSNDKNTLSSMHQVQQDRLSRAETDLAQTQAELRSLQIEEAILRRQIGLVSETVAPAVVEEEVDSDPTIAAMTEKLNKAKNLLAQAGRVAKDSADVSVNSRRAEVRNLETSLRDRRDQLRLIKRARIAERETADLLVKQELTTERIRILKDVEKSIEGDVKRLSERSLTISKTAVDVASIQEEIAAAEEVTKKIASEVEVLNVELQAPSRVRLIERAEIPRIKDGKQLLKLTAGAGLGMFGLAVAGVTFREYQARRIASVEEVSGGLGLRIVATLPDLAVRKNRAGRSTALEKKNLLIESINSARTYLLHASQVTSHRVIMICSAVGGEGKTTLACHLATSLARSGRRTLLIDCDLRRPSIHRLMDIPVSPGVCEILRGEISPDEAAVPADANLWVIPAGECDNFALQALSQDAAREFFERVKQQYDFVLVDTSPVLAVADSILISQHVDATLFSILHTVSQFPKVSAAYERLAGLGTPILGAIVTGVHNPIVDQDYRYLNKEF